MLAGQRKIMKSLIKKIVSHAVQNNSIWTILNATIIKIAEYLHWERKNWEKRTKSDVNILG